MARAPQRVVLIGWAGAHERQLRGLAHWYLERGIAAEIVLPDAIRNMTCDDGWQREGRAIAKRIRATEGSILVHAFSNAGFWSWVAAVGALHDHELERIRGVILDSAPGVAERMEVERVVPWMSMALMPQILSALGRPPALRHPVLDVPVRAFIRFWLAMRPWVLLEAEASLRIAQRVGDWPHLLIYGGKDELVPSSLVDAFAQSLRDTGRGVSTRFFPDSDHVRHFVRHRGQYLEAIGVFLQVIRGS
jgi:pimeloyl-ACP methyl ester carboxylesterase